MAVDDVVDAVRQGKKAYRKIEEKVDKVRGKEKVGSVLIRDSKGRQWKIKVRTSERRGRYMKVKPVGHSTVEKFRLSAEGYKPHKYDPVAEEVWADFAFFSEGKEKWEGHTEDKELTARVRKALDEMIHQRVGS